MTDKERTSTGNIPKLEDILVRGTTRASSQFDHKLTFSAKGEGKIQAIEEANQ